MDNVMVKNNCRCFENWKDIFQMEFEEGWTYLDVLTKARDYIHQGYHLLTHPLAGSVKPNQTPFKSIILSKDTLEDAEEFRDLVLIEDSIAAYHKFIKGKPLPDWPEKSREDFRTVDLSLMEGVVSNPIMNRR